MDILWLKETVWPGLVSEGTSFLLFALSGMALGWWFAVRRAGRKNKIRLYLNMAFTESAVNPQVKEDVKKKKTGHDRLANLLIRSGLLGKESSLVVILLISMAVGWLAGYILTGTELLANFFVLLGPVVVWQGLNYLADKNYWVIYQQCGEMAKYMANAVRAGMTPERAFLSVAARLNEPLKIYMEDAAHRMLRGAGLVEALREKQPYIRNTPYHLFVRATAIGKKRGGDLGEAYADIHGIVEKSANALEKLRVVHNAGKRRGLILTSIPIGLVVLMRLFAPEYARPLFTTTTGYLALAVVIGMIAAAWLLISQITKVGEL